MKHSTSFNVFFSVQVFYARTSVMWSIWKGFPILGPCSINPIPRILRVVIIQNVSIVPVNLIQIIISLCMKWLSGLYCYCMLDLYTTCSSYSSRLNELFYFNIIYGFTAYSICSWVSVIVEHWLWLIKKQQLKWIPKGYYYFWLLKAT